MSTHDLDLTLNIHEDEDGSLWADIAELPGCFASGADMNELLEAAREAVNLYLTDNPEAKEIVRKHSIPKLTYPASPPMPARLAVESMQAHVRYSDDLVDV